MLLIKNKDYAIHAWQGKIGGEVLSLFATCLEGEQMPMEADMFEMNVEQYEEDNYDERILFVLYYKSDPVGFLACYKYDDHAVEEHFFIMPDHRKINNVKHMIKLFEHWAKKVGCNFRVIKHPFDEEARSQIVEIKELK